MAEEGLKRIELTGTFLFNDPEAIRDLYRRQAADKREILSGRKTWGNWKYSRGKPAVLYLPLAGGRQNYHVPVSDLRTREGLVRWMKHLSDKPWVSPADLGNLFRAVADLADADVIPLCFQD